MAEGTQGPAALVGQVLGGYQLERVLGKGATGAVFLGQWAGGVPRPRVERVGDVPIELPDAAAVKVLILPWQLEDAERNDFRARFLREAETQQRLLRHPHIVTVLAYGEDAASGLTYMVQPYLRGGTLADRMAARTGPAAFSEVAATIRQLADGLDYAHGRGVIHRDIKPANILLDEHGEAYLTDFSIVRLLEDTHTKLTATGQVLGTPQYMAPEQVAGGVVGPEADLYSLGMVAYELVTGRPAFEGASYADLVRLVTLETPPAPRTLRPDLPEPADGAVLKALAKRPTDRFPSAMAFAEAFAQGIQGQWASGVARVSGGAAGPTPAMRPASPATPIRTSVAYVPPAVPSEAQTVSSYTPHSSTTRASSLYGNGAQWPLTAQSPQQPPRRWGGVVAIVVVIALLALVGLQVLSHVSAGRSSTSVIPTATNMSVTFKSEHVYTYNDIVGYSKTTSLTNDDVSVTLVSLTVNSGASATELVVGFHDYDTQEGTNFAFYTLANVYFIGNDGARYQGLSADPQQLILNPGEEGSVTVDFSLLQASTTSVSVHFNTDHMALNTHCAELLANGTTQLC